VSEKNSPKMSDEAVKAKTGKIWSEWFKILDDAGGIKMTHKEIVACLSENYGIGSWWQQMITVTYEQTRGIRKLHEKPEGFQISKSRTISVPVSILFKAWTNKNTRKQWLKDASFTIRKKTIDKNIRITWIDNTTSVEVMFYPKSDVKTQVVVQHSKLPSAKEAEQMKAYWTESLGKLQEFIEK